MQLLTLQQVKQWLPARAPAAHKGDFGRVLVVAGSRRMCGAGLLCAKSALVAGAGLVYWALPKSMQSAFAAALPEAITLPLPENANGDIAAAAWPFLSEICTQYKPSLVVLGPGMGQSPLLPILLKRLSFPLVVDADALNALSRKTRWYNTWPQQRPSIFTPHAMEMARLLGEPLATGKQQRQAQVTQLVHLTHGVCLFKGAHTLVAGAKHVFENTTGGSALAKAGSGDVLAGLIAGLWAQLGGTADSALQAAGCGIYLHGLAGDLAARAKSNYCVLASDTIAYLPQAFLGVQGGSL